MFGFKSTDVFIEEVRCFYFPEKASLRYERCLLPKVLVLPRHRHHVRMHIFNKVLLHVGYMNSPTVGLVLAFGAVDETRITLLMVV